MNEEYKALTVLLRQHRNTFRKKLSLAVGFGSGNLVLMYNSFQFHRGWAWIFIHGGCVVAMIYSCRYNFRKLKASDVAVKHLSLAARTFSQTALAYHTDQADAALHVLMEIGPMTEFCCHRCGSKNLIWSPDKKQCQCAICKADII